MLALDGALDACPAAVRAACQTGRAGTPRVEVIRQRTGGLDERIAGAFGDVGEPAVLVGMDTPQISATTIDRALDELRARTMPCSGRRPTVATGSWACTIRPATSSGECR